MADANLSVNIRANVDNLERNIASAARTVQRSTQQIDVAAGRAAQSISGINPASRTASFALTNFGRVAQDAAYGPAAIANNLNPLIDGFQALQREARDTGTTISKALLSVLTGPAGIGVAVSLITAAIGFASVGLTFWKGRNKEAKEAVDEHTKALNGLIANAAKETSVLSTLYDASQNQALSLRDRQRAVDELQKQYPSYFKNLSDEAILAGKAKSAYDELTKSIVGKAAIASAQEQLQTALKPLVERAIKAATFRANNPVANVNVRDVINGLQKQVDKPGNGLILPIDSFDVKPGTLRDNTKPIISQAQKQYDATEQIKSQQEEQVKNWQKTIQQLLKDFGTGIITTAGDTVNGVRGFDILRKQISELETQLQEATIANKPTLITKLSSDLTSAQKKLKVLELQFKNSLLAGKGRPDLVAPQLATGITGTDSIGMPSESDMQGAIKTLNDFIILRGQATKANKESNEELQREKQNLNAVTNLIGGGLTNAFETALQGTQSFVTAMGQFLTQLISKLVAAALAAAALSALLSFTGLGGLLGIGSSASSFGSLFKGLSGLNFLAEGGITNGPTLAIIGEGKEREVVAPLSKFNSMVNERAQSSPTSGEFKVKGSDLILVLQRADKQKSRLS